MKNRIETAKKAQASNAVYQKGKEVWKDLHYHQKASQLLRDFVHKHHGIFFTCTYAVLLIVDAAVSSSIIQPLAHEFLRSDSMWATGICMLIYVVIIFGLTFVASHQLTKSNRAFQNLAIAIEMLSSDKLESDVTQSIKKEARSGFWWGMLCSFALLLFVGGLGIMRNYFANGHQWNMEVITGSGAMTIGVPLLIAVLLLVLGKFKIITLKHWAFARKVRRLSKSLTELREECVALGRLAVEYSWKADTLSEPSMNDYEITRCLERMERASSSNEDFFTDDTIHTFTVLTVHKGVPIPHITVSASAGNMTLHEMSNVHGVATLQWKSAAFNALTTITVNGSRVPGFHFPSGMHITIDVGAANTEDDTPLSPPSADATPPSPTTPSPRIVEPSKPLFYYKGDNTTPN